MTKIFCDRCKKEIAGIAPRFHINVAGQIDADLCRDCFTDFESFIDGRNFGATKIDNYSDPILRRDNHGIERTTFGAK